MPPRWVSSCAKYPADDDIAAMFAEAWMNTMPWDYWSDAGTPRPEIVPVIAALETIIARNPEHPLALHLYIHAVEASSNPGRAENEADTLASLVPGSGHLVHMPAHLYWRVGRYHDAAEANVRAAAVDEAYIAQCNAQGFYPAMYYPHNIHFLWSAAASMEGRSAVAIEAARKVAANVRLEQIEQFPAVEFFTPIPLLSLVQFGHWDEILAEPAAARRLDVFQRDLALRARAWLSRTRATSSGARAERAALAPLKANDKVHVPGRRRLSGEHACSASPTSSLLGEIAMASDDLEHGAIAHFERGRRRTGRAALHGATVLVLPDAPVVGACAAARRQSGRRGGGVPQRPRNLSAQRLVDVRPDPEPRGAGEGRRSAEHRGHFEAMWSLADVALAGSRI